MADRLALTDLRVYRWKYNESAIDYAFLRVKKSKARFSLCLARNCDRFPVFAKGTKRPQLRAKRKLNLYNCVRLLTLVLYTASLEASIEKLKLVSTRRRSANMQITEHLKWIICTRQVHSTLNPFYFSTEKDNFSELANGDAQTRLNTTVANYP
jgi:hypothetical protein